MQLKAGGCSAVRSLQFGLAGKDCEIRAEFTNSGGNEDGNSLHSRLSGGERGIRTPDTVSRIPVFKTGAFNHSAISPRLLQFYYSSQFLQF